MPPSPPLLALRLLRSATTTSASISAAETRPTCPGGGGLFSSTAWEDSATAPMHLLLTYSVRAALY